MRRRGNKKLRAKVVKAVANKRLWKHKQEKKEMLEAVLKCGGSFDLNELGEGDKPNKPKCIKARLKCLEQLKVASPPLSTSLLASWGRVSKAYAQECPRKCLKSTGSKFFQKAQMVIAELGVHYANHEKVKQGLTPQTAAYLKTYQKKFDDKNAFK